ncbi:hypothetical protein FGIG_04319 [Fasciola gigantica]|uniref:Uncharacterized protein n=1 Tax=Fasciola gigantica TaxID=46835 RepID=A0A504Y9H2_FASGI|nr:hypothetical protein FGIG_04319 [Fasciola gigantica]
MPSYRKLAIDINWMLYTCPKVSYVCVCVCACFRVLAASLFSSALRNFIIITFSTAITTITTTMATSTTSTTTNTANTDPIVLLHNFTTLLSKGSSLSFTACFNDDPHQISWDKLYLVANLGLAFTPTPVPSTQSKTHTQTLVSFIMTTKQHFVTNFSDVINFVIKLYRSGFTRYQQNV